MKSICNSNLIMATEIRTTNSTLVLNQSNSLLERAQQSIAGITFSMMKRPEQFAPGSFPVYIERGDGAVVTDVDGNSYVDLICGLGANSLGHQHPAVVRAITETLCQGLLHSLPTALEVRVAETLLAVTSPPGSGQRMARLFKTGADATSAAVRLARYVTKRDRIVTVGYNGWHDHFQYDTPGIPAAIVELTQRLPLFEVGQEAAFLELLRRDGAALAAVVLSVPYNRQLSREFVQELRRVCTAEGILLVMDEIVTGFRLALGGAQEYFGVAGDLACYSKALAAGMPLSALVGPKELLERMNDLQVSTTFGGELLSLAVCEAALGVYRDTNYVGHIAGLGRRIREGVNNAAEVAGSTLRVRGYDAIPMFLFAGSPAEHVPQMTRFVGLMAQRGFILRRDVNFVSAAHTSAQVEALIGAASESLALMKS